MRRSALVLFAIFLCVQRFASAQSRTQATIIEAEADNICGVDCPPPLPLPKVYGAYFYCLKAGDQFLIGEHQMWEIGLSKLARLDGQSLTTRWDQKHIWVTLPSGWAVRLNQYNYGYGFRNLDCRNAAELRSLEHGYTRPASVPGEPAEPVKRGNLVYGWAICSPSRDIHLVPVPDLFNCKVWDLEGQVRQDAAFQTSHESRGSQWDETVDGAFMRIHLKDGKTLERTSPHN